MQDTLPGQTVCGVCQTSIQLPAKKCPGCGGKIVRYATTTELSKHFSAGVKVTFALLLAVGIVYPLLGLLAKDNDTAFFFGYDFLPYLGGSTALSLFAGAMNSIGIMIKYWKKPRVIRTL